MTIPPRSIQTRSGVWFNVLEPRVEDVRVEDIAHALSNLCRYGGHSAEFYSVAQHCEIASRVCPPELAVEMLVHDASEAYVGDVVRPLKYELPDYMAAEEAVVAVVRDFFGLLEEVPDEVKYWDRRMLLAECRDLGFSWIEDLDEVARHKWSGDFAETCEPVDLTIVPLKPTRARARWLARYRELAETNAHLPVV